MASVFGIQVPYLDQVQTQAVLVAGLVAVAYVVLPGVLNQVVKPTGR